MVELKTVIEAIAASGTVSDMSKFDANKTFKENEIDSLDVLGLFLAVEERLGIKFTEDEVNAIQSAAQMVDTINRR